MGTTRTPDRAVIETDVPARLDRLPWGRFHWLLVSALGITVGWYLAATAVANLLGPLLLGHLFDTVGRRRARPSGR